MTRSDKNFLAVILSGFALVLGICAVLVHLHKVQKAECESRGGVYVSMYKSESLCLNKESLK